MLEQPRIPEIGSRWRPYFSPAALLSSEQATHVIQQVLGAFESVDALMDYRATGGFTESIKGQWNDYAIYRPGRKQGWGVHLTAAGAGSYNCLRRVLEVGAGDLILMSPEAFYDYGRSDSATTWCVHWAIFQADSRVVDLLNWPEVGAGVHHLHCPNLLQLEKMTNLFREISRLSIQADAEQSACATIWWDTGTNCIFPGLFVAIWDYPPLSTEGSFCRPDPTTLHPENATIPAAREARKQCYVTRASLY